MSYPGRLTHSTPDSHAFARTKREWSTAMASETPDAAPSAGLGQVLLAVTQRVVWFKPAHETLRNEVQFLSHVMVYGSAEDAATVRSANGDKAFRDALRQTWTGTFDPHSYSYWHTVPRMLPVRHFGAAPGEPVPEVGPAVQRHVEPPRGAGSPDRKGITRTV